MPLHDYNHSMLTDTSTPAAASRLAQGVRHACSKHHALERANHVMEASYRGTGCAMLIWWRLVVQGLDAHHLPALQRRGLHADDAGPAAGAHPRHPGRARRRGGAAARRPHHLLPRRPEGGVQ